MVDLRVTALVHQDKVKRCGAEVYGQQNTQQNTQIITERDKLNN